EALLGVGHGYTIASFKVSSDSWLAGKTLRETRLRDEGVVVLGIYRRLKKGDMIFLGAPGPETLIQVGDELIVYGHEDTIANLSKRLKGVKGDEDHIKMIQAHRARRRVEEAKEKIE
ncbi:MAG: TrkA C-terminal domain-containing protein, partial [Desulfurococcales archaeon]|nr:TrkA C-terminal domain-containing protein [Desulfurococcales archaeon]